MPWVRRRPRWVRVVGPDGGHSKMVDDAVVLVPVVNQKTVTLHREAFQAAVWHALSYHLKLMRQENKWDSLGASCA
jgi:hypothetical protein